MFIQISSNRESRHELNRDLIWTSFDELYEQIKDNFSDYQIPYCMLIVYISDVINQPSYSAFITNQLT